MSSAWSWLRRSIFTAIAAGIVLPSSALAQRDAPPMPQLRTWSTEGREPTWRARIEASDGFVVNSVSLLRRLPDGAILSIIERKPGDEDPGTPWIPVIERRDNAGRTVWRQRVPGLPTRYWRPSVLAAKGPPAPHLTVVANFGLGNGRDPAQGRIIALDERSGVMRVTGTLRGPKSGYYPPEEDGIRVDQAVMLSPGLIMFVGHIGLEPGLWWIGLRRAEGTVVWDVFSRLAQGDVADVRRLKDGFEISVLQILSHEAKSSGTFILRIDGAGRVTSSARFRGTMRAPVFTRDGGLAWLQDDEPETLVTQDRLGHRRFAVTFTGVYNIMACLEDGTLVLTRENDKVLISPDGKAAIATTAEVQRDGSLLVSRCDDERDCRALTLSLFARPQ